MMIAVASLAVSIVVFIIYALDRKAKGEPISWETAGKLSLFGGILTSGVVFASATENITEVVKAVVPTQDMFVGVPTF
jgi:hypothetical protein